MNRKLIWFICFGIMAAAQLGVPLSMMNASEQVIADGKEFWFRTAPVDPYDPLRGKYITLDYKDVQWVDSTGGAWSYQDEGTDVFVELVTDSAGFAVPVYISREPSSHTTDYVVARLSYITEETYPILHVDYPFTRLYMDENKAGDAEQIYWDSNRSDTNSVTYAVVMVKSGESVLTDVRIDGVSVRDLAGAKQEEE